MKTYRFVLDSAKFLLLFAGIFAVVPLQISHAVDSPYFQIEIEGVESQYAQTDLIQVYIEALDNEGNPLDPDDNWIVNVNYDYRDDDTEYAMHGTYGSSIPGFDMNGVYDGDGWWYFSYEAPGEPAEYDLQIQVYCGHQWDNCAKSDVPKNYVYDLVIPFTVECTENPCHTTTSDNLRINSITTEPSNIEPGEEFFVKAEIENTGNAPVNNISVAAIINNGQPIRLGMSFSAGEKRSAGYVVEAPSDIDSFDVRFSFDKVIQSDKKTISFESGGNNNPPSQSQDPNSDPFANGVPSSDAGGPLVQRAWAEHEEGCQTLSGPGETCESFTIFADVRMSSGERLPINSDATIRLWEWSENTNSYVLPTDLDPLSSNQTLDITYFANTAEYLNIALPKTMHVLIEATWNNKTTYKEFDITMNTTQDNDTQALPDDDTPEDSEFISQPGYVLGYEQAVSSPTGQISWFTDTDPLTEEGQVATKLARLGIIGGYPDGEFKGDRFVNRAEASKFILYTKYDAIPSLQNNGRFPDVVSGEWYERFVIFAEQEDIIRGHSDGFFRPADSVNTVELIAMLQRAFDLPTNIPHEYQDISGNEWYAELAGIAWSYSLFSERGTLLDPSRKLTRREVAIAIHKLIDATDSFGSDNVLRNVDLGFTVEIPSSLQRASALSVGKTADLSQSYYYQTDLFFSTDNLYAVAVGSLPETIELSGSNLELDVFLQNTVASVPNGILESFSYSSVQGFPAIEYFMTSSDGQIEEGIHGMIILSRHHVYSLATSADNSEQFLQSFSILQSVQLPNQ